MSCLRHTETLETVQCLKDPGHGGGGGHTASIRAWTPSDSMKTKQIKTIYPQRKTTLPFKLQINQNIFLEGGGVGDSSQNPNEIYFIIFNSLLTLCFCFCSPV